MMDACEIQNDVHRVGSEALIALILIKFSSTSHLPPHEGIMMDIRVISWLTFNPMNIVLKFCMHPSLQVESAVK